MSKDEKKLCTTCGDVGDCGGTIAKCANCWEVESRLKRYLESIEGLRFVHDALINQTQKFAGRANVAKADAQHYREENSELEHLFHALAEQADPNLLRSLAREDEDGVSPLRRRLFQK